MGFRRRTRRRAIVAGAAIAHHEDRKYAEASQAPVEEPAQYAAPAPEPAQYAPAPADPAEQIDHFAQLHASGAMTDEEFAAAKAKVLGG